MKPERLDEPADSTPHGLLRPLKLAIMQPYFFPYLGYFQLIRAVDRFVVLDDVNYIKQGWVNRNRILLNQSEHFITVPLQYASSNRRICDTRVLASPKWRFSMLRTLQTAYGKAPCFAGVFPLAESVLLHEDHEFIHEIALHSIRLVCSYLGIGTEFRPTSRSYGNAHLKGCSRILDICEREGAREYLNLPGGRLLYRAEPFLMKNIALRSIQPHPVEYPQRCARQNFVPCLSILDALMFNDKTALAGLLSAFDTISAS